MQGFIKYIRKNNKKALAILGVLCMVSFVATMSYSGTSNYFKNDQEIGKAGDMIVHDSELRQAENELRVLRALARDLAHSKEAEGSQRSEAAQWASLSPMLERMQPTTLFLLITEAKRMQVSISDDELQGPLTSLASALQQKLATDQQQAIRDMLLIVRARGRVATATKISLPLRAREMEMEYQKVAVQLVQFKGEWFKETPTTAPAASRPVDPELKKLMDAQFEKYKNIDPVADDFGFGYRYPDRVKVQYLEIKRAEVEKAVRANGYRMNKYYLQDLQRSKPELVFSSTQPTTKPDPLSGDERPFTAEKTSPPTTRPFEDKEVQDRIAEILTDQDMDWMYGEINQITRSDWQAYREAMKNQPTTAPGFAMAGPQSSLGVPFDTNEYLTRVAERVAEKAATDDHAVVTPVVHSEAKFRSSAELAELADQDQLTGIGETVDARSYAELQRVKRAYQGAARQGDFQTQMALQQYMSELYRRSSPFPAYAVQYAEPIVHDPAKLKKLQEGPVQPLALFQFSTPMVNEETQNVYVFRVSDASPAHAAASMDDPWGVRGKKIAVQVEEDVHTLLAFQEAQHQAQEFLKKAEQAGMAAAAKEWNLAPTTQPLVHLTTQPTTSPAGGLPVVRTGLFGRSVTYVTDYSDLQRRDLPQFTKGAFALLEQKQHGQKKDPLSVIGLPRGRTVVVAQLAEVEPLRQNNWLDKEDALGTDGKLLGDMANQWWGQWFNEQAVEARMHYKITNEKNKPKHDPSEAPPDNPLN